MLPNQHTNKVEEKIYLPIVAEDPYVMNSKEEIVKAYNDFYTGKYGEIKLLNKK